MKLKIIVYITVCLILTACGSSQSLKKAEQSFSRGEYFTAARYYKKAYSSIDQKKRNLRAETAYKLATCYRLTNYNTRAKSAYGNAIRYNYPDSISFFYWAESLRKNGEYTNAEKAYNTYLQSFPNDSLAWNGLYSCKLAIELKKTPTLYKVKKMDLFNSRRSDFSPMYADGNKDILYFTSTRNEAKGSDLNAITGMKSADIFLSKRDEKGAWQKPVAIDSDINTNFEDGSCTFSSDGKTIYFTRCRTNPDAPTYAEIFSATRSGGKWGNASKCLITKDTLSSVAHPAITPTGDYLYFVSDMSGGYGGLDLWRISIQNNTFGYFENLGPEINTPGDEMFPTFDASGTLYFSSNGHPGLGGLDIFQARLDSTNNHWKVSNMGIPINSFADDFGMTFEPERPNQGFFSSNRGDARGWDHIYSFELPQITQIINGSVYNNEGDALPNALVTLVSDNGTYLKINTKQNGTFTQAILPGQKYIMLASSKGYLNEKKELTTDIKDIDYSYNIDFVLSSITRPVLIDNIFYEFDRADLTSTSTKALDELIKLLNDNPNITIELASHCDYKGNENYNERLSQRRAESVVRYLISKGIKPERLTAKGYGEQQPKTVNKALIKEAPFLKLGDRLTEEFIRTLTPEQQDICNAINRRTEFQVLRTTYGLYK